MDTILGGTKPETISRLEVSNKEFMLWQYVPIKLAGDSYEVIPPNLKWAEPIIERAIQDYEQTQRGTFDHYIYVTAKSMWVNADSPGNRPGWHIDGFMTEDTNYIWSDCNPTEFWWDPDNIDNILIYEDHQKSMFQMEVLADSYPQWITQFEEKTLLRLDSGCIHRVAPDAPAGFRNFVKVSFSRERYLAEGNSINHKLDYDWTKSLVPRTEERNCPQGHNK